MSSPVSEGNKALRAPTWIDSASAIRRVMDLLGYGVPSEQKCVFALLLFEGSQV